MTPNYGHSYGVYHIQAGWSKPGMRYISFWKKGHTIFLKNEFFRFCFVVTALMQERDIKSCFDAIIENDIPRSQKAKYRHKILTTITPTNL